MSHLLRLAAAVISFVSVQERALSQFFPPPILQPVINADDTARSVLARAEEINKETAIPKNEFALYNELNRIDAEINQVSFSVGLYFPRQTLENQINQILNRSSASRNALAGMDCENFNPQTFSISVQNYVSTTNELRSFLQNFKDVDFNFLSLPPRVSAGEKENCQLVRRHVAEVVSPSRWGELVQQARDKVASTAVDIEKIRDANAKLQDALRQRRAKLREALNSQAPEQQISSSLPLILGILGGACVLAIIGVRLFSEQIQMEWVASGQVIQFVTVMVLLSVVTALALSNKLQENTLGTLLGGVAGYVLAQGVGRAAARDVSRTARAAADARPRSAGEGESAGTDARRAERSRPVERRSAPTDPGTPERHAELQAGAASQPREEGRAFRSRTRGTPRET